MKQTSNSKSPGFPAKRYAAFAVGDAGYQFIFYWISAYVMIFYTDVVGIPTAYVSVLLLVVRLYDAINDPLLGSMMDKTKSRYGRYRPWIAIGGIGLAVSTALLFWAHPDMNFAGKIVYMYVTYMVAVTFSTLFYMSYLALGGCLSPDSMIRTKASGYRTVMQSVGMLLMGYLTVHFISKYQDSVPASGYLTGVIVTATIGVVLILITAVRSREVITSDAREKISLRTQFRALFHNKAILAVIVCMFCHGLQMQGRQTIATYYFTYYAGNFSIFQIFNTISAVLGIVGAFAAPYLYQLVKSKAKAARIAFYLLAGSMILQYFIPCPNTGFYILTAVNGLGSGLFTALIFSMIPDATDYSQRRDKIRIDGFLAAMASFAFKAGGSIGAALIGVVLNATGYVANQVQNAATLKSINLMMTVAPAAFVILGILVLFTYRLDETSNV